MNSEQLAALLIQQSKPEPHQIELNDATLGTKGLDDLVKTCLGRADGTLWLVVDPSKIDPNPPASGFSLGANVPTGERCFLGLGGNRVARVEFIVGTTIDLVLTLLVEETGDAEKPTPAAWKFSDSYPQLQGLAYDELDLSKSQLAMSTGASGKLLKGLVFNGELTLSGVFEAAADLLQLKHSYPLSGPISGSGDELKFSLGANFKLPSQLIGDILELEEVGAGVDLISVKHDGAVDRQVQIYLDAQVTVHGTEGSKKKLKALAGMPVFEGSVSNSVSLGLVPPSEGELVTSLTDLGSLLAGTKWDSFLPDQLTKFFEDFGLKGYGTTWLLSPTSTPTLSTMRLDVGTLKPFPLWGDNSLALDATWTVVRSSGASLSYLLITADFTFGDKLEFIVTVDSEMHITGKETKPLSFKLSQLNEEVFGKELAIPDDLFEVTVESFGIAIDYHGETFEITALFDASFHLFGAQILALEHTGVAVTVHESKNGTSYVGRIEGIVSLGPISFQTDAVIASKGSGTPTVLTLHLVGETVGSMLDHLVHLVDPTYDLSFPDPWDKLLEISLDALVLEVDVTNGKVSLVYEKKIDLGFVEIDTLTLAYTKGKAPKTASSTKVEIAGSFLGIGFGPGTSQPALAFDPVKENPPAPPGKGSKAFDLQYAGLGQHVAFPDPQPKTIGEVIERLGKDMAPVPPGQTPGLEFSAESNWLIGAQFTVADTVAISAIFNDPNLYGVLIKLSGAKAKVFAGLSFEILYRKISDSLGVYHVELKLPDAMRNLQFGAVSLTLPIVVLDIYTNGNFRVDFGFPNGLDFSRSFSLQMFPFVGYGGFYFALLNGSTSTRVPQIANGTWSPVVEFGVGMSIGVGKTVDEGILKGGISVTVVGILEGVLAWFHPTEPAPTDTYYWFQGTIAVTGKLYATIDFAIIQASVDVTAYLSATLTIEAHKPIYVEASASVSVRVSVKIVFFTIHLSFSATVDVSFTIGSATTPPWVLSSQNGASSDGAARTLRGQRTLHSTAALRAGERRARRRALVAPSEPLTDWPAARVVGQGPVTLPLTALLAFTKAESWTIATATRAGGTVTVETAAVNDLDVGDLVTIAGTGGDFDGTFTVASVTNRQTFAYASSGSSTSASQGTATAGRAAGAAAGVLLLSASNSISKSASTHAEHRRLGGDDPAGEPFNRLMEAMLAWGVFAERQRPIATGGAVRTGGVATVTTTAPHGLAAGEDVVVAGVGNESFDGTFEVASVPSEDSFTYAQAGLPDAPPSGGGGAAPTTVTADSLERLRKQLQDPQTVEAAFGYETLTAFLAKNFVFEVTPGGDGTAGGTGEALFPVIPALSLSDNQPQLPTDVDFGSFNPVGPDYAAEVRAYFQTLAVEFEAAKTGDWGGSEGALGASSGPSMAMVVFGQYFNMLMSTGVRAAIDALASYAYTTDSATPMSIAQIAAAIPDGSLNLEPLRIVAPNQEKKVLDEGCVLELRDVVHQAGAGDTFAKIAGALAGLGAQGTGGQPYSAADLIAANPGAAVFVSGAAIEFDGLEWTTLAGETLELIAIRLLLRAAGPAFLTNVTGLGATVEALQKLNPGIGPNEPLKAGQVVAVAESATYTAVAGDTLTLIAAYALAAQQGLLGIAGYVADLIAANPKLGQKDPTKPQPAGEAVQMPPVTRTTVPGDSVEAIAATLLTTVPKLEGVLLALPATTPLLAPQATLHAPLCYPIQSGDTFAKIAAKFDLTLADVAAQSLDAAVFAAAKEVVVADLEALSWSQLAQALLESGEWNNASAMISRFLLSGLRLPDPHAPPQASADAAPPPPSSVRTKPLFALTGQQFAAPPAGEGYKLTLANAAGAPWLKLAGSASSFELGEEQARYLAEVAKTPLEPGLLHPPTRLALYRMTPPRTALGQHVAWQAAVRPSGCLEAAPTTANPSIWRFPDALLAEIDAAPPQPPPGLLYQVVSANHGAGDSGAAAPIGCYAWGTIVDFTVSRPQVDGHADSVASAYVLEGSDDTGAALLHQVQKALEGGAKATLYLLRRPDQAGPNPSGLASDELIAEATYLLKTNLSTLTHSGMREQELTVSPEPESGYATQLGEAAKFVQLLWEASITRSGGFYLNYAAQGGGGLPASAFGDSSTAQLSLLVMLEDQAKAPTAPLQPFNNCVVVGDAIDTTQASVFAQPANCVVQAGDSLTTLAATLSKQWGASWSAADLADLNAEVPQLLAVGGVLDLPGSSTGHQIGYGETLAGIAGSLTPPISVTTLIGTGANATSTEILAAGASMQLAAGVLRPATTVPPGTAGFEITRPDPDPEEVEWHQLKPKDRMNLLFNLVGWAIAEEGGFGASGDGLPTTPTDALRLAPDGLTALDPDDAADANWYYAQSFAVSPFATARNGSSSPALPPAAANPYNGIATDPQTGKLAEVTVALGLQDVYGNRQALSGGEQAQAPVGYYDDLVGIGAWPSIAASYLVTGSPAAIELALSLQQASYIPSASTPVPAALASIAADLQSYRAIYYQYVQPDVSLSIETTLALDPGAKEPASLPLPLPKPPLLQFVAAAWVYLSALATTEELVLKVSGSSTSVTGLVAEYGTTAPQLFEANGEQPAVALFGGAKLEVPWMYSTAPGDELKRIVKHHEETKEGTAATLAELAQLNEKVPLPEGSYVTVPSRTVAVGADRSLAKTAAAARASVGQLAADNASRADLLAAGATFYLGGASHPVAAGESLEAVATKLGSTPAEVAVANQSTPGVLAPGAQLQATDARVEAGEALAQLAKTWTAGNLETLAKLNEERPDLFAPATQIRVGRKRPAAAGEGETLATFAAHQGVTLADLAATNEGTATMLAAGAEVRMPGTLKPTGATATTHSTYAAASGAKLADVAAKYGATPAEIVALNPDVPGLLEPRQPIRNSASGKTVTTEPRDSFDSIVARFGALSPPVTVTLDQLAADVADQVGLLTTGGLWICPPLRADAGLRQPTYTLEDLTNAYHLDLDTFATANAATLGMVAAGVDLAPLGLSGQKTTASDTLNSLSNRTGGALTPVQVASALASSPLLAPGAAILPVPPPPPAGATVEMTPCLKATVSRLSTVVVTSRNPKLVDPDFEHSPAVAVAKSALAPEVEADAERSDEPLRLKAFATALETALPGLRVAVGDPEAEGDPAGASTVWVANFGNSCGPKLEFKFEKKAEYFALPPLTRSLLAGTVEVPAYSSEQFPGPVRPMNFQAVDLDVWLNEFLEAVDLFLTPSYAVPAYALAPAATTAVVADKEKLAAALKAQVTNVLESGGGEPGAAQEALYQALLTRLSAASSVDTLVQVPVRVQHGDGDATSATRLSGKLALAKSGEGGEEEVPSAYSFSTAKVPLLSKGESGATFLFSVKSPGSQRAAQLDLQYDVVELELPEPPKPDAKAGEYQGSSWLQLVTPLDSAAIGKLDIPIPLRAYPSPVTLVSQEAKSPEKAPVSAAEMLAWELEFDYQHDDAAQDTPLVEVSFNPTGETQGFATPVSDDPVVEAVFRALAKFTTIWPALRNDLALLAFNPPGKPAPTVEAAVEAFATLVKWVAEAFEAKAERLGATPPAKTYYWRLQKGESEGHLTTLKLTAIDPSTWSPGSNPTELWPAAIKVRYGKTVYTLTPGAHDETSATYAYPAGVIPAGTQLAHSFCFEMSGEACKEPPAPSEEPGKQTFCFPGANILTDQSARAGVSIWRNLELVEGVRTTPAFVYQTPISAFASNAIPSNTADTVPIGAAGESVATALGAFLEELFKGHDETFTIRLAGGYSYAVTELEGGPGLSALMPIFLIPTYEFDPATDPKVASDTFVCQVEAAVDAWQRSVEPSTANAYYLFDLTVFAGAGGDHPLIHAPRLRYSL